MQLCIPCKEARSWTKIIYLSTKDSIYVRVLQILLIASEVHIDKWYIWSWEYAERGDALLIGLFCDAYSYDRSSACVKLKITVTKFGHQGFCDWSESVWVYMNSELRRKCWSLVSSRRNREETPKYYFTKLDNVFCSFLKV